LKILSIPRIKSSIFLKAPWIVSFADKKAFGSLLVVISTKWAKSMLLPVDVVGFNLPSTIETCVKCASVAELPLNVRVLSKALIAS